MGVMAAAARRSGSPGCPVSGSWNSICIVEMQNQVLLFTRDGQSYAFSFEYEKQLHQLLKAVQLVLRAPRFSSSFLGLPDA